MRKDIRARDFSKKVKIAISERDSIDGWPCCVYCGRPSPMEKPLAFSNAHYISRAQLGLGIPENGLTLCPECHRKYDQSTARKKMKAFFREYLRSKYPDWNESDLYYRRFEDA